MTANPSEPDSTAGIQVPDPLLAATEAAINAVLALDPEGAARLAPIAGRIVRVELTGFGTRIDVVPNDGRLALFGAYAAEPDCIVRGTPGALLRMAVGERREDAVFAGAVTIDGDNRVAQTLGEVLKGLDIDWEEQLSRLVGDGIAHRLGARLRAVGDWARRSREVLTRDVREYLIEEGRVLPGPGEVRAFLDDVDRLRDDVERLEARVERLARRTGSGD